MTQSKVTEPSTEFWTPCPDCNGLGCTGWGPTAVNCERCGTLGLIPMPVREYQPVEVIDPELYEALFGDEL